MSDLCSLQFLLRGFIEECNHLVDVFLLPHATAPMIAARNNNKLVLYTGTIECFIQKYTLTYRDQRIGIAVNDEYFRIIFIDVCNWVGEGAHTGIFLNGTPNQYRLR